MRIVQINTTCSEGSTGKICVAVSELLNENGINNLILYSSGNSSYVYSKRYCSNLEIKANTLFSRVLGNWGFEGIWTTWKMIKTLESFKPDIIHLHNIHTHACKLDVFFRWVHRRNIRLFWTFHDCWAFTGYCMHYRSACCEKWKQKCEKCPQKSDYSWFFDRSRELYERKKALFSELNLTIIVPSEWMLSQVKESFLGCYPVVIIQNGIDLNTFYPVVFKTDFINTEKYVVLGVSNIWYENKGIDTFIRLSEILGDRYQIILVGEYESCCKNIPDKIKTVGLVKSQSELAMYYSRADVLVNVSCEETFPTVNIESLACGTPVISFDNGGSSEIIDDRCGYVVPENDFSLLVQKIINICETKPFSISDCVERARCFNQNIKFEEYISLYKKYE